MGIQYLLLNLKIFLILYWHFVKQNLIKKEMVLHLNCKHNKFIFSIHIYYNLNNNLKSLFFFIILLIKDIILIMNI